MARACWCFSGQLHFLRWTRKLGELGRTWDENVCDGCVGVKVVNLGFLLLGFTPFFLLFGFLLGSIELFPIPLCTGICFTLLLPEVNVLLALNPPTFCHLRESILSGCSSYSELEIGLRLKRWVSENVVHVEPGENGSSFNVVPGERIEKEMQCEGYVAVEKEKKRKETKSLRTTELRGTVAVRRQRSHKRTDEEYEQRRLTEAVSKLSLSGCCNNPQSMEKAPRIHWALLQLSRGALAVPNHADPSADDGYNTLVASNKVHFRQLECNRNAPPHIVHAMQGTPPQPAMVHAVTMPTVQDTAPLHPDTAMPTVQLPSFSLPKPPYPAQISTFSVLSFALVSGARIIDYRPTTIQSPPPLTIADNSERRIRVSSYSSLAGALNYQHAAETSSYDVPAPVLSTSNTASQAQSPSTIP
ncbi:uncharacterized protein EDB91DRAFT_1089120 [Suillus paluster]|uniref:uncharacterized protein n=1 Tax=Suillus paluster TaxID=48578 RepID=UPI001B8683ED|nr:uncharacterized protein EDB91DRAFT_1089120 [Suillus paluster]KAG1719797.1 hypothetical protein EDB91DRAFT_1089120 [Suillus paluster]